MVRRHLGAWRYRSRFEGDPAPARPWSDVARLEPKHSVAALGCSDTGGGIGRGGIGRGGIGSGTGSVIVRVRGQQSVELGFLRMQMRSEGWPTADHTR